MKAKEIFIPILFPVLCLIFFTSCREQRVKRTASRALKNIETKDYVALRDLIGTNDTSMFDIVAKMVEASYFLDKYHSGTTKDLKPVYTDSIDDMGRHIIIVPLYSGYDSLTGLYNANVILGVGPFNLFSPDKLTGFDIERGVDSRRRGYLIDNNIPTYDFDSVNYVEYEKLQKEGW